MAKRSRSTSQRVSRRSPSRMPSMTRTPRGGNRPSTAHDPQSGRR